MADYNAGIQSFKQQFDLDTPSDDEDYSAGIDSFKQQFGVASPAPQTATPTAPLTDTITPPVEVPPGPKLNITPSNRHLYPHLTDEQAREHEKVFEFGDILPSLESGYKRTWGNILNLMADKESAYRENPDI